MIERRKVQRAFTGLVGRFGSDDEGASVEVEEPSPHPAPIKKRRGRPLVGDHKKTAAEIKRDQRKREKQELSSMHLSQEQQRIYDQARRRIEAELNEAFARGDEARAQEIRDIIRGQAEQREYNAQLARAQKPRGGGGLFIADAPRGLGKIVYGTENILAVGDKNATVDKDGDAGFEKPQRKTAYHNNEGEIIHGEDALSGALETEDQFHEKKHPVKWRRDPKRSEFDRREQEEKIFGRAGEYLESVIVAIIAWDGEAFSVIRNADSELRCKLCGRCSWTLSAMRSHLVDDHARRIAPTSTKKSRANQKLLAAALKEQDAEIERSAAANGWHKVSGKW